MWHSHCGLINFPKSGCQQRWHHHQQGSNHPAVAASAAADTESQQPASPPAIQHPMRPLPHIQSAKAGLQVYQLQEVFLIRRRSSQCPSLPVPSERSVRAAQQNGCWDVSRKHTQTGLLAMLQDYQCPGAPTMHAWVSYLEGCLALQAGGFDINWGCNCWCQPLLYLFNNAV